MKKLLVLDMGTYCDNAMMDLITNRLQYKNEIVYITTTGRETPSFVKQNYYFDMPSFITNAEIDFDIMRNVVLWGIKNPLKAYKLYDWISTMKNLIEKAVFEHNGFNGIILHYSVTMLLWRIDPDLVIKNIYIVYYAPGLINKTIPWIFDGVMKMPDFELYKPNKKIIEDTWESYYKKMSDISMYEKPIEILDRLKKAIHIFCWDPAVTAPYSPVFNELHVKQVGFLHAQHKDTKAFFETKDIMNFVSFHALYKHKIALLTFGSYASSKELQNILPIIFNSLKNAKYSIIFHVGKPGPEHDWIKYITDVYIHHGYLPYDWIVPQCDLVMFTGSVCMQTVCLYNKVRMIFVPLLAEQFFWARNYHAFTGVPFCNYLKKSIAFRRDLTIALKMDRNKEMRYLNRVSKSMREHDGIEEIAKIFS